MPELLQKVRRILFHGHVPLSCGKLLPCGSSGSVFMNFIYLFRSRRRTVPLFQFPPKQFSAAFRESYASPRPSHISLYRFQNTRLSYCGQTSQSKPAYLQCNSDSIVPFRNRPAKSLPRNQSACSYFPKEVPKICITCQNISAVGKQCQKQFF